MTISAVFDHSQVTHELPKFERIDRSKLAIEPRQLHTDEITKIERAFLSESSSILDGALLMPNSIYAADSINFWREKTQGLPYHIKQKLFSKYKATLNRAPNENDLTKYHKYANGDLRRAVDLFEKFVNKKQLWLLDGKTIESKAKHIANSTTAFVSDIQIDGYRGRKWSGKVNAYITIKKVVEPDLEELGLTNLFTLTKKSKLKDYYHALIRYMSDEYLQKKFETQAAKLREYIEILFGNVQKYSSPYSSNKCQKEFKSSRVQQQDWINDMVIQDIDDPENVVPLAAAINSSVSNPVIRRNELMTRIRGFENIAEQDGFVGSFVTLTAPGTYHSNSQNFNGNTPSQTQKYMTNTWAKVRSKLARKGIQYFGIRVTEPHADATPHWHMILFFIPEDKTTIESVIFDYFTQQNRFELIDVEPQHRKEFNKLKNFYSKPKNKCDAATKEIQAAYDRPERRVKFVDIDGDFGSATGYIAKYVAKNIDAAYCKDKETGKPLLDDETGKPLNDESVVGVLAWASRWRIRQFQFLGGAPVTTYRECRKYMNDFSIEDSVLKDLSGNQINDESNFIDNFQEVLNAADTGDFAKYVQLTGGAFQGRNGSIKTLLEEIENSYGELITKVKGFKYNGFEFVTKETNWQIVKAKTLLVSCGFSSSLGSSAFESASGAPWSADNNCTDRRSSPDQVIWQQIQENGSRLSQLNNSPPINRH